MRHYLDVRASLAIGLSFAAHVGIAAALLVHSSGPKAELADPAPQTAGETFELPMPDSVDVPLANASPSPAVDNAQAPLDELDGVGQPPPRAHGKPGTRASRAGRPSAGHGEPNKAEAATGSQGSAALYGAVGERSATDLATTFTRSFPQAASADPAWRSAPLGSAGEADVLLTLDESGHITGTQVLGAPSAAMASGIRRTMSLIGGRAFTAKGKVTKLHLVGSVSSDVVHDGLHGDVFAIGGSFATGEGDAFFALAIGRRIDVRVHLR